MVEIFPEIEIEKSKSLAPPGRVKHNELSAVDFYHLIYVDTRSSDRSRRRLTTVREQSLHFCCRSTISASVALVLNLNQ